ncbi:hypothetical protein SAMN02744037_02128 [Tepidibacter formicigenes DSM 15518]|uniref:Uncharacterized protein n=2 Tax=Tepidibacter TaxID=214904 RepID=A0A1M6RK62_9FIRM|nr:hypothetical protein SAMN02744037_02128 [Tepidibacter formicigenes DSM 15518]
MLFVLRYVCTLIEKFVVWIYNNYIQFEFDKIYGAFFVINYMILFLFINSNSIVSRTIKGSLCVIQASLLILILYKILVNKNEFKLRKYLKHMAIWSGAALFVTVFSIIFLIDIVPTINIWLQYLMYIQVFVVLYYCYRCIINRFIRHWISYSIYFFILPVISLFVWVLIGDSASRIFGMPILTSSIIMGYMTIILTILIFNLEIYWAPKEVRNEVKVAVYLILAVYSTVSYCFFISDYLSEPIYNFLQPYSKEIIKEVGKFSKEMIRNGIEEIIKWTTIPYLVGAVFGCFSLELIDRNENVKSQKEKINNEEYYYSQVKDGY